MILKYWPALVAVALAVSGCASSGIFSGIFGSSPEARAQAAAEDRIEQAELARERMAQAIDLGRAYHEIVPGMSMRDVLAIWGPPSAREVAGNRLYGNERWVYHEGLDTSWSLDHDRVVYFESGRVAGWQTARSGR